MTAHRCSDTKNVEIKYCGWASTIRDIFVGGEASVYILFLFKEPYLEVCMNANVIIINP